MLIPISHEDQRVSRLPGVTIFLAAAGAAVFLDWIFIFRATFEAPAYVMLRLWLLERLFTPRPTGSRAGSWARISRPGMRPAPYSWIEPWRPSPCAPWDSTPGA